MSGGLADCDALLIDLDGVIRIWPEVDHHLEERHGLPNGSIRQVAFEPALLQRAITGVISDDSWREQVTLTLEKLHPDAQAAEAVRAWSEPIGSVNTAVYNLLSEEVARHVPLHLVTNATSRLRTDLTRLGIAHIFTGIVNSSAVGVAKPDAEIFLHALSMAGTTPGRALFVDDSLQNVVAARALGIRSLHFQDEAGLRGFLRV